MVTILVMEDDPSLREDLVEALGFEGFTTLAADNGRSGVELACQHLPDLIISDIMMPEMTGYQAYQKLQSQPDTAAIPFIFLTAYTEQSLRQQGMEFGGSHYLTKPFMIEDLVALINSIIT